jgi:hypothetical protein
LATLEWAISLIPGKWSHDLPESYPSDAWSVAMNVAHLTTYEELLACPLLEALRAGKDGSDAVASIDERVEEARRIVQQPWSDLMSRLHGARLRQVKIVEAFPPARFNAPATGLWGAYYPLYGQRFHSAAWVATKTFKHIWEHGNAIMRVALYAPC